MIRYKALICDVDGTLILNKPDGIPSLAVTKRIAQAQKKLHVGVATSRPHNLVKYIFNHLALSGPSIIHGGAQVMDAATGEVFIQHAFPKSDIQHIYDITKRLALELVIDEDVKTVVVTDEYVLDGNVLGAVVLSLEPKAADHYIDQLSAISTIAVHKIPSWKKGKIDVSVGPLKATKHHAVEEVAKLLGIQTSEIIAVGDGYNDAPLLKSAGLKIAMGNAVPELKAMADYVAPSVEEDGIATIIEKFIL